MGMMDVISLVASIRSAIKEIRNLIGDGQVKISLNQDGDDFNIMINIINPSSELEMLAGHIIELIPEVRIPGLKITLNLEKQGNKLVKYVNR